MAIHYTKGEEWANALSHGIGILIGIIGGGYLLHIAMKSGDVWAVRGMWLYLFGMLASYITSTWYHSSRPDTRHREVLRKFDHARHLSAHCRQLFSHHAGQPTRSGLLGLGNIQCCMAVCIHRNHSLLLQTERTQLSGNNLLHSDGMQHLCCLQTFMQSCTFLIYLLAHCRRCLIHHRRRILLPSHKLPYMHSVFHLFVLGGTICHMIALWYIL